MAGGVDAILVKVPRVMCNLISFRCHALGEGGEEGQVGQDRVTVNKHLLFARHYAFILDEGQNYIYKANLDTACLSHTHKKRGNL